MILQSTIQGDESLWSNSLFYKYLSVIFLYTNEYSCVQDHRNCRMISQTPSDKLTQSTGARNRRLPGTASPGGLRDGAQSHWPSPPQLLTNVCFHVFVSENVPKYTQALQMTKTEHRTVILDAFPTVRKTMITILKCLRDVPMVLFCFVFYTKQQTDIQQRNELQYLRMVTFIDK